MEDFDANIELDDEAGGVLVLGGVEIVSSHASKSSGGVHTLDSSLTVELMEEDEDLDCDASLDLSRDLAVSVNVCADVCV